MKLNLKHLKIWNDTVMTIPFGRNTISHLKLSQRHFLYAFALQNSHNYHVNIADWLTCATILPLSMQTNELGSGTLLNIRTITFLWTTLNTAVKNKVETLNTVSPTGSIRVQTKTVKDRINRGSNCWTQLSKSAQNWGPLKYKTR